MGEISDPKWRGQLGSVLITLLAIGITVIMTLGVFVPWKTTCLVCVAPMVVGAGLLAYVWDSPYYLYAQGRREQARKAVEWLHGGSHSIKGKHPTQPIQFHQFAALDLQNLLCRPRNRRVANERHSRLPSAHGQDAQYFGSPQTPLRNNIY